MFHGHLEKARPTTFRDGASRHFEGREVRAPPDALTLDKVVFLICAALLFLPLRNLDVGRFPAGRSAILPFKVALLAARGPGRHSPCQSRRPKQIRVIRFKIRRRRRNLINPLIKP